MRFSRSELRVLRLFERLSWAHYSDLHSRSIRRREVVEAFQGLEKKGIIKKVNGGYCLVTEEKKNGEETET